MENITNRYKPSYQQIGTRAGMSWDAMRDKINPESLSSLEQQELSDYTAYRAESGQLFSNVLKELSGVAVNPTEFKRAEAYLPNPGTGIFDGDSPTQLFSKVERLRDFTDKALAKYSYIKSNGPGS